ncbi:unnamed protein product, partial [Mesorhabditis belari]|uniref:Homeobox domain-containing protein n=1 Tax=Mesorhabditis belari TaxID=2138241 RepID=A0AAF3E968_9BILA
MRENDEKPIIDGHGNPGMWTANMNMPMFPFWINSRENYQAAAAAQAGMLHPAPFDGFYPTRWEPSGAYDPPKLSDSGSTQMFFPPQIPSAAFASSSPQGANSAEPPYPTDPFPSTSTAGTPLAHSSINALQNNYKLENVMNPPSAMNAYYMYPSFPASDYSFLTNWKTPSMKRESANPTYRTGPGTNNVRVRTAEKYRNVYSDQQRLQLEAEWQLNNFITADRKAELSTNLQLTERQIKIWFQNRRAKERRENKKKPS